MPVVGAMVDRPGIHSSVGFEGGGGDRVPAGVSRHVRDRVTGVHWRQCVLARHGPDPTALTLASLDRQRGGQAIHAWAC